MMRSTHMAEAKQVKGGQGVLVVYGEPPRMDLSDASGRKLDKKFVLRAENKASFETALRRALSQFLGGHLDISAARFVFIRNADDFASAVRAGSFSHVIYYGHALDGANALLPTMGNSMTAFRLANILKGTTVHHFDILGCSSASIAAEISTEVAGVRVGNLRGSRNDNVEVNPETLQVIKLQIDPQPLYHFDGKAR
jgi:hypothetical protein